MERIALIEQAEVRWHLAMMLPRLKLNKREREAAAGILTGYLTDRSHIVKACALRGLVDLAKVAPGLRDRAARALDAAGRSASAMVRARAGKMLAESSHFR